MAATGENAICVSCARADIVVGSLGVVLAESMMGEITPRIAREISANPAQKLLIPTNKCHVTLIGMREMTMGQQIDELVERVTQVITRK